MDKQGKITREDIISDEALNFSKEYVKNIKKAIKANKKLQKSMSKIKEKYFYSPMCGFIQVRN